MSDLFEKATKKKVRFTTTRGVVSVEDLWDMPLTHQSGFSLDDLAKHYNRQLKNVEEESFVEEKTVGNTLLELKFDIVKHIIKAKIKTKNTAEKAAETKATKQKLMGILATKKDEELMSSSVEDIEKMLEKL